MSVQNDVIQSRGNLPETERKEPPRKKLNNDDRLSRLPKDLFGKVVREYLPPEDQSRLAEVNTECNSMTKRALSQTTRTIGQEAQLFFTSLGKDGQWLLQKVHACPPCAPRIRELRRGIGKAMIVEVFNAPHEAPILPLVQLREESQEAVRIRREYEVTGQMGDRPRREEAFFLIAGRLLNQGCPDLARTIMIAHLIRTPYFDNLSEQQALKFVALDDLSNAISWGSQISIEANRRTVLEKISQKGATKNLDEILQFYRSSWRYLFADGGFYLFSTCKHLLQQGREEEARQILAMIDRRSEFLDQAVQLFSKQSSCCLQ